MEMPQRRKKLQQGSNSAVSIKLDLLDVGTDFSYDNCFAREILSAFGFKLQYWRQKVKQNKIASFSRLASLLEDCENITFKDINDTIVRHLIKLRKQFSDYFLDLDIRYQDRSVG
ncbi:hypothetical protein WA026_013713 [Henosepilachna vigintioctopunctata]|uniref:Uncharacterized protein n=1 Tax=Henosepilachna vigintioctopunctata TaxID=420089 RepID=A0AAW1V1A1_9CUCU